MELRDSRPHLRECLRELGVTCAILAPLIVRGRASEGCAWEWPIRAGDISDDDLRSRRRSRTTRPSRSTVHGSTSGADCDTCPRTTCSRWCRMTCATTCRPIVPQRRMLSAPASSGSRPRCRPRQHKQHRPAREGREAGGGHQTLGDADGPSHRQSARRDDDSKRGTSRSRRRPGCCGSWRRPSRPWSRRARAGQCGLTVELESRPAAGIVTESAFSRSSPPGWKAIKFSREGSTDPLAARRAGDVVCFSVTDTGTGIPDADLEHVFERHWKARQSTREGTGLGLFIAKGVAVEPTTEGSGWRAGSDREHLLFHDTVAVDGEQPRHDRISPSKPSP